MKRALFTVICLGIVSMGCNNMQPDDSQTLKAYPNPYNPNAGVLTIEKTDGTAFSTSQNDLIIYDFSLQEIYKANVLPSNGPTTNTKLTWSGIDNTGLKVSPGIYYIKVMSTTTTGTTNADSMFKLIVQ